VPFTLFAHQVPAVGLKIARPRWFDGTALAIGSMAPDLAYALGRWRTVDTHDWDGLPLAMSTAFVLTMAARWIVADVAPAHFPDLGPVRLRSWRVTAKRQPALPITVISAAIGVLTHLVLDAFTHEGRWGERLLGYDGASVEMLGHTKSVAGTLQLLGTTVGSLLGLLLLVEIGRRRLLEQWYGAEAVRTARAADVSRTSTIVFWTVVAAGTLVGIIAGWGTGVLVGVVRTIVGCGLGAIVASLLPICRPRNMPDTLIAEGYAPQVTRP
jgi:hypothetical protein